MKFIHTADIHLGAEPDAGSSYTAKRPEELWNSFERLLNICEEEQTDLLLIAGDLFHRQPLLRELKELDYLFSRLTHTQVVLMAGNHDYLKSTSYYRNYKWQGPVHMFLSQKPACMEFKELGVRIYGLSYEEREITEPLYEKILPEKRGIASILLAHGGDEKHIPFRKNELLKLGYDYIALGHVHKPQKVPGCPKARYSGSPLPFNVRETSFDKQVIAVTLTAGSPCTIRELPLPVYKPIEVWHCENIDDAVEQCEANADRECWVYLEVKTDHYIHEEDIKKMKAIKADILSITPVLPEDESEDFSASDLKEQPFDELVKNFYRKKFHVDIGEETFSLLTSIIEEN